MTHYAGMILHRIKRQMLAVARTGLGGEAIAIDNVQQNGTMGVHQARVRLQGDPTVYRLILAPSDAPISVDGRAVADYFAKPLGDG